MSHVKNIVKKPWGYEYLLYENDKVALWFLYIKSGERTSTHCHPNKTTGLVLLDGEVEVSFLSDKNKLSPLSKIMIRKGLFHSTQAIGTTGACVLEIETPVDKHDLVRFKDSYGREGKPYEDSTFEYPKEDDCVWLEEPLLGDKKIYNVGNSKLSVVNIKSSSFFDSLEDKQNVVFLQGGLKTDYDVTVAGAGDVVAVKVLKQLKNVFSEIHDNTLIMLMEK